VEAVYWCRLEQVVDALQRADVAPVEWRGILGTSGAVEAVFKK
jgi:hypothetical protein